MKADSLTRRSNGRPSNITDNRNRQQFQTILTPDRVEIRVGEAEESLFKKVVEEYRLDDTYKKLREVIAEGKDRLDGIRLANYRVVNSILYKRGLLQVPELLRIEVLREVYNQPASGYPE